MAAYDWRMVPSVPGEVDLAMLSASDPADELVLVEHPARLCGVYLVGHDDGCGGIEEDVAGDAVWA